MHILITTDTLGGVWTYTRELASGLVSRGVHVTLVSFGNLPAAGQTRWIEQLRAHGSLTYHPTAFKLEWMQNQHEDLEASTAYLRDVIRETRPDVLHFNQFYYGAIESDLPRVVVAHSDVVSWWLAVHGDQPPQSTWLTWYRNAVVRGLTRATAVRAPSQWMLDQVTRCYGVPRHGGVIHNGRSATLFHPNIAKVDRIVTVGRIWDRGKNTSLLLRANMPAPVYIVGADREPESGSRRFTLGGGCLNVHLQPQQNEQEMSRTLGRAVIYVAPSQYEPFGLAPLEAALSGCALVLSDIPPFRELWEGAAVFFRKNDEHALRLALELMMAAPGLRRKYSELACDHARRKFTAEQMVDQYMQLYHALAPAAAVAA